MDTRQLRSFVQIVESGSLSKAARQLFVVQPALSQQMARLEQEVGKPLLIRSARGVVPTDNGQALYQHAKFVLRQIDDAVLIARQDFSTLRGRVAVGLAPSTSCMLGLPLLRRLQARFPGLLPNLVVAIPDHLEERARQGQLDVAILFSRTAASELACEALLHEEAFVMLPRDSTLVAPERDSLRLAELAALPLVLSSANQNLRRRVMLEFERAGLKARVAAEIDSLELMMRHVLEGGGATLQPMAAARAVGPPERWRSLSVADVQIRRTNYLCALPVQKLSAGAAAVRQELKQLVQQLLDDGTWQGVQAITAADA